MNDTNTIAGRLPIITPPDLSIESKTQTPLLDLGGEQLLLRQALIHLMTDGQRRVQNTEVRKTS